MKVHMDRAVMGVHLAALVDAARALPEVRSVNVRGMEIFSADDISRAVDASWHDECSDMDIKIGVELNPADVAGYAMPENMARFGFDRSGILGIAPGGEPRDRLYRIVLKDGMRFDLGVKITENAECPALGIVYSRPEPVKDEGKFWPRMDLAQADNFWFVQVMALGKLMRGDYLIADHLTNMQINETLVAQMVARDDEKLTNIHRYGYREVLAYRDVDTSGLKFRMADATAEHIARRLYAAGRAYDALVPVLNPDYEPRCDIFMDIWAFYDSCNTKN